MNKLLIAGALMSGLVLGATPTPADANTEVSTTTVRTDFSGRPPFARRTVSVEEAARLAAERNTHVTRNAVQVSQVRGRPPHRRMNTSPQSGQSEAVFARFEETDRASADTRRRSGPPGKLTSRRP